jgi:YidC/Oxa1 family membrane protein insertase
MKNRNVILFVIGSMVLLAGQFWLSSRYAKPAPPAAQVVVEAPRPQAPAPTAAPAPVPTPVAAALPGVKAADPAATHSLQTEDFLLTWQVATGALRQTVWRDGTKFFPEAFAGLGAFSGAGFEVVRNEAGDAGTAVIFENAAGDRLSYLVPRKGFTLRVEGLSPRNAPLNLVVNAASDEPVKNLGRVFSLSEKSIEAVAWAEMLHDPFFSFLGAKRKVLPAASDRLGLDAGLNKDDKAQQTHYFAALWKLPRPASRDAVAGYQLLPANGRLEASLYLGPKQAEHLLAFEKPFTRVIDYGFFGAVSQLLFWVLRMVYKVVGNWGWAIVIFTVIIRAATWTLNTKQTISMLRMKDFEPHQKAIQAKYEKFGSDMTKKAEMQKELMALYKKNGHNPMGGCLPMLLQMPIFLALWSMLNAVFELRHAPFFGWIVDLSAKDPYYIFPVLMGGSMFAQQYMTPAVGDPAQRKMMLVLMPAMMTFFFAQSAAGLTIYYFVFNMIGLVQTWWVMRSYQPQPIKV